MSDEFQESGLQFRFTPLDEARLEIDSLHEYIEGHRRAVRHAVEVTLKHFAGFNLGSFEAKTELAKMVMAVLEENHLRVECTVCGAPAIIRCLQSGNSKTGVFLFDHYLDTGRTFHGGLTAFPRVNVVDAPKRRKNRNGGNIDPKSPIQ